jgi:hypothetical protein
MAAGATSSRKFLLLDFIYVLERRERRICSTAMRNTEYR